MARTLRRVEKLIFPTSLAQKHAAAITGPSDEQDDGKDEDGAISGDGNLDSNRKGKHRESIKSKHPARKPAKRVTLQPGELRYFTVTLTLR
jgi:hypothetical protein